MSKILCYVFGHRLESAGVEYLVKNREAPIADYSDCPPDAQPNILIDFYYISSLWNEYEKCARCGLLTSQMRTARSKFQYYQMSFLRNGQLQVKVPRLLTRRSSNATLY